MESGAQKDGTSVHSKSASESITEEAEKSLQFTEYEHSLGFWDAMGLYWPAVVWSMFINLATILKGMDGGIVGSLVGLEPFKRTFGYEYKGNYVVPARWVSAFNYANPLGGIVGALLSGWAYDRLGPRLMMTICSSLSIAILFIQFFSSSSPQLFVGELLNGITIAFYPICASAYVGEVTPLSLRGFAASMTNLGFVVGQLIASGILKGTDSLDNSFAYRIPIATQWILPVVILAFIYFCPDPPFWLCKKGRYEAAEKSLRRLATPGVDVSLKLAHIRETLRLEDVFQQSTEKLSLRMSYLTCFRGPNLRRLVICVMAYDMQAFTGNILFINYAVYFFEMAGLNNSNAFSMNVGLTAIGFLGTCIAWPLLSYVGRRAAYLWGCAGLTIALFVIGALDLAPRTSTTAPVWAQCALILVCNFIYDLTVGPFCFVLLAEVSSAKLRSVTIALATVTCHIMSLVFSVVIPYAMNEDEGNWRGKLGFLFSGLSLLCTVYCFFCLPETKGRTFEELDILFERRVSSRGFEKYVVDVAEHSGRREV
ncbi:sugar transporter [Aspergillus steynii IBT 23096]|uniref:Sugar transporter n=1 Tax=Aspergillus steynii IBT 23096 TaxID=1392250 RepID=A0A2I2G387_9EURO|nr:sugar transporter [Aspergillus steynii IBT 23096]PLB47346.1 sugar transporter [Aspergillus steynii IBT 23096]